MNPLPSSSHIPLVSQRPSARPAPASKNAGCDVPTAIALASLHELISATGSFAVSPDLGHVVDGVEILIWAICICAILVSTVHELVGPPELCSFLIEKQH